jgi:hypothetical protein
MITEATKAPTHVTWYQIKTPERIVLGDEAKLRDYVRAAATVAVLEGGSSEKPERIPTPGHDVLTTIGGMPNEMIQSHNSHALATIQQMFFEAVLRERWDALAVRKRARDEAAVIAGEIVKPLGVDFLSITGVVELITQGILKSKGLAA